MPQSQTITVKAGGLILTPNDLGETSESAMAVANNIVLSRDNIAECRRGTLSYAAISTALGIKKLIPYKGRLLAWYLPSGSHKLAYSDTGVTFFTDYTGTYELPANQAVMRHAEGNGNLYFTHIDGVKRLDSATGVPVAAGAPIALDVEAALVSAATGTALGGDGRFAYRALWTFKDANKNLIMGAPSPRFTITSPAVTVSAASLVRTGTTVTATVVSHGFQTNDIVTLSPGETNFPVGNKTITGITGTTFTYTESGTATSSKQSHRFRLVTVDATVKVTIPFDATTTHSLQVYRSPKSENAETEPTDNLGLVWETHPPTTATITTRTRAGTTVTVTTSAAHGFQSGAWVDIEPGITDFPAGSKLISVTDSTHFTYTEAGAAVTSGTSQTARPLTMVFTDSLPDTLLGAALYTNPQQEGILESNIAPPAARDLCEFKGSIIYANVDLPPRVLATLLAVGAPSGLQSGDTFVLGSATYTGGAAENYDTGVFKIYTTGTPTQNVQNTANSICRTINRRVDNSTHICYALIGVEDEPGRLIFQRRTYGGNTSFDPTGGSQSRITAWSPNTLQTGAGEAQNNAIYWSKNRQPDAVPFLSFTKLGSADKKILRVVATRDSVFILKEDGVWRLSGDGPSTFRVDPVDTTLECVAPETALALDGTCFVLTEQGVVRITETGIVVVSRGIEPVLQPKIAQGLRQTVSDRAFAIGYESDRKYMLWLPVLNSDDTCPEAYIYDLFTDSWTRRTDEFETGLVNPADDLMYLGLGSTIYKERKTFIGENDLCDKSIAATINSVNATAQTVTLADASLVGLGDGIGQGGGEVPTTYAIVTAINGNVLTLDYVSPWFNTGACLIFKAILMEDQWNPQFAQNPAALHHMREIALVFREHSFANVSLFVSSNLSPSEEEITFKRTDYDIPAIVVNKQFGLRTLVPLEKRRASQLNIRYEHQQARTKAMIQAMAILFNPGVNFAGM